MAVMMPRTTRASPTRTKTGTTKTDPGPGIPDDHVAIGRVLGAWGIRGDIKVEPLADLDRFQRGLAVTIDGTQHTVERVNAAGRQLRLKLSGLDYRDAAAALRGAFLTVPEAALGPAGEDRYYRYLLIGLRVVSTDGDEIGEITDVFSTGSNDVFVTKTARGDALIPAVDDVVQGIDLSTGTVTIEVIPGLLPE
jgi:16S rRNA processing protein RimM